MLHFAARPDPVFRAVFDEALKHTRDELEFEPTYTATDADQRDMDARYRELYPGLARCLERRELLEMIDGLLAASQKTTVYEITDYHWLVIYESLAVFCGLHNDDVLGDDGKVGAYIVDHIDFDAIVDRFFWDTDFHIGSLLLEAEEKAPGQIGATGQAWKIAAGLRPDPDDVRVVPVQRSEQELWPADPDERSVPASGYVGPYPLREPDATRSSRRD